MTKPTGYFPGDWLAACYQCGRERLASTMRKHWQGYWLCPEHWEPRHPQDFVRGVKDIQTVPWSQPQSDLQLYVCGLNDRIAIPGYMLPGCALPGWCSFDPNALFPQYVTVYATADLTFPTADTTTVNVDGWTAAGAPLPTPSCTYTSVWSADWTTLTMDSTVITADGFWRYV